MCLLIVLRGFHENYPILVASNRDEFRARKASPPGLWVGERRRMISPRDRKAGGTWVAVNDRGAFAGLTNVWGTPAMARAPSRGRLPHLALDRDDLEAGLLAVRSEVEGKGYDAFQLLLCDGNRTVVLRHVDGELRQLDWEEKVLVVSNVHAPGKLAVRGLDRVLGPVHDAAHRLELLRPLLVDRGGMGMHPILKKGDDYGTVSSSLIAVPKDDPRRLVWRYAAGPPDEVDYKNYGNLGRRLIEE